MASPQLVARRGNNRGASARRRRAVAPSPPHGKALVVHNFNAVAGLSRQVGLFRGRASRACCLFAAAAAVASCAAGFRSSGRLCRSGGGGHRGIDRRRLSGGRLAGRRNFLASSRAAI
jgi:hypothetical protein